MFAISSYQCGALIWPVWLAELEIGSSISLTQRYSSPKNENSLIAYSPVEGWVKCLSPQNPFGDSGLNSVAAKSNTKAWNASIQAGVNDAVSSRLWMLGLPDTWMTPHEQYGGIQIVFFFKRGPQLLQLYWIWLQSCLPLRLQKCIGDSNTSTLLRHSGE